MGKRTTVAVLVAVCLAPLLGAGSPAAATGDAGTELVADPVPATEWPLLYTGIERSFDLAPLDGDPVQQVTTATVYRPASYSNTGDALASAVQSCRVSTSPCPAEQVASTIVLTEPDGSVTEAGEVPGAVEDLTWDGRGSQVAVLSWRGQEAGRAVYPVPLDGGGPVLLVRDTAQLSISDGITWNPVTTEIAFVRYPSGGGTHQVWGVSAGDRSLRRLTEPLDPDGPTQVDFRTPDWSPDGTELAVWSFTDSTDFGPCRPSTCQSAISLVRPGDSLPTPVAELPIRRTQDGGSVWAYPTRPRWSADGSHLLYGVAPPVTADEPREPDEPRLVTVATGAEAAGTRPDGYPSWRTWSDWQPCPGGECVTWGGPSRATLAVAYRNRPRIAVDLTVTPAASRRVTVVLARQNGRGAWTQVRRQVVRTSAAGRGSVTFAPQKPGICRLRFSGVGPTQDKTFSC